MLGASVATHRKTTSNRGMLLLGLLCASSCYGPSVPPSRWPLVPPSRRPRSSSFRLSEFSEQRPREEQKRRAPGHHNSQQECLQSRHRRRLLLPLMEGPLLWPHIASAEGRPTLLKARSRGLPSSPKSRLPAAIARSSSPRPPTQREQY